MVIFLGDLLFRCVEQNKRMKFKGWTPRGWRGTTGHTSSSSISVSRTRVWRLTSYLQPTDGGGRSDIPDTGHWMDLLPLSISSIALLL